jgi:hypothetical protein
VDHRDLQRDTDPAHLRDALRRALRDPSVELAFWLPEYGAYADLAGNDLRSRPRARRWRSPCSSAATARAWRP